MAGLGHSVFAKELNCGEQLCEVVAEALVFFDLVDELSPINICEFFVVFELDLVNLSFMTVLTSHRLIGICVENF